MERNLLSKLLIWLLDEESDGQSSYSARLAEFGQRLTGTFPRTTDDYLRKALSGSATGSMFDDAQFIHLEAIDKDGWMIPILSIRWNFASAPAEFGVRVALFMLKRTTFARETRAVAFRIEASHGADSRHCYPHAQFIRNWDAGGKKFPIPSPQWVPESFPAWPLDSEGVSPVSLLVAVLVTLYGKRFIDKLVTAPFRGELTPYLIGKRYLQQTA